MNILLVYPHYPDTYWSFKHALPFISKKAAVPPLGLITVSAMLPAGWNKKLIDMNVEPLMTKDIKWADFVFISAMYIQKESVDLVIDECLKNNVKIVAGGPLFTQEHANYPQIDHFILNEAEITLTPFLKDLFDIRLPRRIYRTDDFADMRTTPVPDYHLLSMKDYASMNLQVSRGCPFACNFCEITTLLGHKVRMKDTMQVLRELDMLYKLKWRGAVAIVDDNFVGNKKIIKEKLLPAMREWMKNHKYPFTFTIQTSINVSDDQDLICLMADTGINSAFIGIETPDEISLHDCNKVQNSNRDLLQSVKRIHHEGIEVAGGFIVGFDSDSPDIFRRQIDFIQKSGIVSAMVGLLNAPKHTKLYQQLKAEDRITAEPTGSNTDSSMNFIPKMNITELVEGYRSIISNIYSAKPYYKRVRRLLLDIRMSGVKRGGINYTKIMAFIKSIFIIGIFNKGRREYWKFMIWTLIRRPALFANAMTYAVYGYHFRTVYGLGSIKSR